MTNSRAVISGRIERIAGDARPLNGAQVRLVTALLDSATPDLPLNAFVNCRFDTGKLRLGRYLGAVLHNGGM